MRSFRTAAVLLLTIVLGQGALPADGPAKRTAKEALQPFNELIGSWRGTGYPSGTAEEKRNGFWIETQSWEWQFKDSDAWLKLAVAKGKHLEGGELRYLPETDSYRFTVRTAAKDTLTFEGQLKGRVLTLDRTDEKKNEKQRFVIKLLHPERFLFQYFAKPASRALFAKVYEVGNTREGVAFAKGDGRPECIVSGGLGTIAVSYMGETYYVCCGGCRTEFNADPGKYVREYQQKKAKKKSAP
jgi:hypothetical protein